MSLELDDKQLAYCFFASKYNLPSNLTNAPKAFVPERVWDWYDVDRCIVHASNWQIRYGVDHIKIENGVVTDHYKKMRLNNAIYVYRYDVDTGELYEKYFYDGAFTQIKLSASGDVKQINICADYTALPIDFKVKLDKHPDKHPDKHLVCGYGRKPYGDIVGFWVNEDMRNKYLYSWCFFPLEKVIDDVRFAKRSLQVARINR